MGGFGSGRSTKIPTVESGLRLELSRLMRDGMVRPGVSCTGTIVWSNTGSGEKVAAIVFETMMRPDGGRLRLIYTSTSRATGQRLDLNYWIDLVTTPQPFGGLRWWFVCPRRGCRAAKLYMPSGATQFASRPAYRMAYRSQRETRRDRALSRAQDIRKKLGGSTSLADLPPQKPKWMHWTTYSGEMKRMRVAEAVWSASLIGRFKVRLPPGARLGST